MKINEASFRNICDKNVPAVVVYGFGFFGYKELAQAIRNDIGMQVYTSDDYVLNNEVYPDDKKAEPLNMFSYFKFLLNHLLLENLRRYNNNQPLVPLIFVVAKDGKGTSVDELTKREDFYDKWVTHTELRRCFKLATEFKKLEKIAEYTFNFVELQEKNGEVYLHRVPPFWQFPAFDAEWEKRKKGTKAASGSPYKHNLWRDKYNRLIEDAMEQKKKSCPK